jgi:hypothetical protein
MSQGWVNIQSFFRDNELIGAINDLSIAIKLELAGVRDDERMERAEEARRLLKQFWHRLSDIESAGDKELLLGVDSRFQSLMDAIAAAQQDSSRYQSVLIGAHEGDATAFSESGFS